MSLDSEECFLWGVVFSWLGFPGGSNGKEFACNAGNPGLILGLGRYPGWEDPRRREWQPTPEFLPGEYHGQRSLVGYSPLGHKRVRHDLVTKKQQIIKASNNYYNSM